MDFTRKIKMSKIHVFNVEGTLGSYSVKFNVTPDGIRLTTPNGIHNLVGTTLTDKAVSDLHLTQLDKLFNSSSVGLQDFIDERTR